jgi:hypothetical protein
VERCLKNRDRHVALKALKRYRRSKSKNKPDNSKNLCILTMSLCFYLELSNWIRYTYNQCNEKTKASKLTKSMKYTYQQYYFIVNW